ncbi:unnamed protein product [Peronospora destructor]|uniref:PDZ domain-containing protein n=1 Tax=Peronospora destructor TaxID=86335 RepID=A0AAV0VBB9_9STRA|nr:unnamed protein product [Peronospora destructor]
MATLQFLGAASRNQMNLKRAPTKELEKKSLLPFQAKTKCRSRLEKTLKSLFSSVSSSETSLLPLVSAPRTVEIMWGGYTAPGFTLKRKRTGAILVTTVTEETEMATTVKVGSELKLVGGFPVNRLTLKDIKKVMLLAPKPVSLVFVNTDDVVIGNVNELSAETRLLGALSKNRFPPTTTTSFEDGGERGDSAKSFIMTSTCYSETSENNKSKKRKVSKLQVALVRVNQLLNRPVRQAGLHIAVGKSIVV